MGVSNAGGRQSNLEPGLGRKGLKNMHSCTLL